MPFIFLLEFALGKDKVTFLRIIKYKRSKRCTLSGHILQTLQDLSNDHSQLDPINGYEALDYLNELVQNSRAPHEHESHHHGNIEDVDFNLVRNEETENKGIFNGKGLQWLLTTYFVTIHSELANIFDEFQNDMRVYDLPVSDLLVY